MQFLVAIKSTLGRISHIKRDTHKQISRCSLKIVMKKAPFGALWLSEDFNLS